MPVTPLGALPYPALNEPPNVPLDLAELALATDGKLFRALPVADGTKPTLTAGDRGFLIDNVTTGNLERWSGTAWVVVGGSSGGGGGGGAAFTAPEGIWTPSSIQSIGTALTVIAFGDQETGSSVVTRSAQGAGHKFTVSENGAYCIDVTCRFDAGLAGRRFCEVENAAQTVRYVAEGFSVDDGDTATLNMSRTKRLAAGEALIVVANQSGQTSLPLVPEGVAIEPGFVRLSITKVAG